MVIQKTAANDHDTQVAANMKFKVADADDPDIQEDCSDKDKGVTSEISLTREAAMRAKNMRQEEQAKKAMKQCE